MIRKKEEEKEVERRFVFRPPCSKLLNDLREPLRCVTLILDDTHMHMCNFLKTFSVCIQLNRNQKGAVA